MTAEGLGDVWRESAPHVLAALVRRFGDFDAAEDAAQEALLAATRQWPREGVPAHPTGWLVTVASRRLVDRWRSDRARGDRELREAVRTADALAVRAADAHVGGRDDSLALLLLCCHPALSRPSQVALTLRAVGGLTTAQVARGFMVPEATAAQRISRAKATLRRVGAPFEVSGAAELPGRVAAVAQVLYLVFTEGHTSTTGAALSDPSLATEAIRLARALHERLPADGELSGLLALMLLTHARRAARVAPDGSLVPLAQQDRTRWDAGLVAEGVALVEAALPVGPVGPYQLQAAVAAVHAEAVTGDATDWPQIELLYGMLSSVAPGPAVTLNHAVAVAEVRGPEAGLDMLEPLRRNTFLARGHRLHAVRGHLLERAGRGGEAHDAYVHAARLATSIPEQRYLNARAAATDALSRPAAGS
ncbi:sigma factor-like helix-turn-helix DNA-binding protein [Angustibacter aerolatus]